MATTFKPRLRKILQWSLRILALLLLLAVLVVAGSRAAVWLDTRITGENGVDEGCFVLLNGQEQFLRIRGEDRDNPVILWLHGGPADSDSYVNHVFQKYLVEDYTLVNWDQRGCGRTYYRNSNLDPDNETATFQQAQLDLDALVDYLRQRFSQDKVIIMGHSYGTMLGSCYVLSHPEKVSAYIGVGQVVSLESEHYAYLDALEKAKALGHDTGEMEQAYADFAENGDLMAMMALRGYTAQYHSDEISYDSIWMGLSSPYMGVSDLCWFALPIVDLERYFALNDRLFDYTATTDVTSYGLAYAVPVGFLSGSCDWTTPVKYTQDYYEQITAPDKEICILQGCGHSPQLAAPEDFSAAVNEMLGRFLP